MSLIDKTYYNGKKAQKFICIFAQSEIVLVVDFVGVSLHLTTICKRESKIVQDIDAKMGGYCRPFDKMFYFYCKQREKGKQLTF